MTRVAYHADKKEWKKFVDGNMSKKTKDKQAEKPFIPPFARRREKRKK